MIDGLRVLALVPARGGSKGIPGKNLAEVGGAPMLDLAVGCARRSRFVDEIAVTSDDAAILARAASLPGVTVVRRPPELATDDVAMVPVVADNIFAQLPAALGKFLHSGVLVGTFAAALLNILFNGIPAKETDESVAENGAPAVDHA